MISPVSSLRLALQQYLESESQLINNWDFAEDMPRPGDGVVGELSGQLYLTPDPEPVGYAEIQPVIAVQLRVSATTHSAVKTLLEDAIWETQLLIRAFDSPSYLRPYTPWVMAEMGRSQRPDQSGYLYHLSAGCSVVGSAVDQAIFI